MEHGTSHYYGIIYNFSFFLLRFFCLDKSSGMMVRCGQKKSSWCILFDSKGRLHHLFTFYSGRGLVGWKIKFLSLLSTCLPYSPIHKPLKVFFFPSLLYFRDFCFLCYYFLIQWFRQMNLNLIGKHEESGRAGMSAGTFEFVRCLPA